MGRAPCCSKVGLHRGPWTPKEDSLLINYIRAHGEGQWRSLPKRAGLLRCGKSCRLRWVNYLKPDIKRGNITPDEDDLIIRLHTLLGNRWSLIAGRLSGRTDNEIKNYWNTHLSKRLKSQGADLSSHGQSPKLNRAARQEKRKSTKKYKNQHDEHKIKCNNNNNNLEREKPKLFMPKPIRITSLSLTRNNSFESNMSNDASSSHDGGSDHHHHHHQHHHESTLLDDITCTYDDDHHHYHHGSTLLDDMPWTWHHDDGVSTFLIGCDDDDDDMMSNDGSTSNNGTKLEKLYEEYLQLLNVDDDHAHVMDGHEHAST